MAQAQLLPTGKNWWEDDTPKQVDTSGLTQAGQQESAGFQVPTVNPTAMTGTPSAPVYKDNGAGGQTIDWSKTATDQPQAGPGWTAWTPGYGPDYAYSSTGAPLYEWDQPKHGAAASQFPAYTGDPQSYVQTLIRQLGLKGAQTDPTALNTIAQALQRAGVNAQLDTRSDQYHKGLMINGQFVKMLDGSDNWIYDTTGGAGGGINPNGQGQVFDDPASALLEQFIKGRLTSLQQPQANPALDDFLKNAGDYIKQQNAPVYSDQEEAALRTKVFSQLEQDRATALQQTKERLSQMGHGQQSGTFEQAAQQVNKHFDQLRAQRENDLFTGTIAERQKRLQQALQVGAQAANLTSSANATQDARGREAVTTAGILPELASSRLRDASSFLGAGGSNPSALMSSIAQLLSQNQQQQGNTGTAWQGVLDLIMNALK